MKQNEVYGALLIKLHNINTKIVNGLHEQIMDMPYDYLSEAEKLEYEKKIFEIKLIAFSLLKIKLESYNEDRNKLIISDYMGKLSSDICDEWINKKFLKDTNESVMLFFDKLRVYHNELKNDIPSEYFIEPIFVIHSLFKAPASMGAFMNNIELPKDYLDSEIRSSVDIFGVTHLLRDVYRNIVI